MSSDPRPTTGASLLAAVRPEVTEHRDALVAFRRDLHRHPETGFEETRTARVVAERLAAAGIELHTGIAETGLVARIWGGNARAAGRRTILLRADMDALPLQEESGAEYASEIPGAMHACGHDGHTAILAETALLAQARAGTLDGDLALVFQPAEEGLGGALKMIEDGVLGETGAEAAFGLHLWSPLPVGKIAVTAGACMAAADEFEISITGKGGHAAFPHTSVDAVVVGSYVVSALQTIVSRQTDPLKAAVVTVGSFHAGSGHNIIAESAVLRGTIRAFDAGVRDILVRGLRETAEKTCSALGAGCEFRFFPGYPPTINDREMAEFVAELAAGLVGPANVVRDLVMMGAEDMSYFLQERPGCFFFVGAGNEARGIIHPHHSPRFDIDEDALSLGCEMMLRIAERYFARFPVPPARPAGAR